jgi:hypothetical protein
VEALEIGEAVLADLDLRFDFGTHVAVDRLGEPPKAR